MANVNKLLAERLKKKSESKKMEKMASRSATGNLTSFAGVFGMVELSASEKETLQAILVEYQTGEENLSTDLVSLISITSEVKAITNQAVLLHGERIKKAQTILKRYQEGAFTAWLIATYGNRQTPYNFLQYYEFVQASPQTLRPQIEKMPRQAIYTLASRDGPFERKLELVENYKGETKHELLSAIRDLFPLDEDDKRRHNPADVTINALKKLSSTLSKRRVELSRTQKAEIEELLSSIHELIGCRG